MAPEMTCSRNVNITSLRFIGKDKPPGKGISGEDFTAERPGVLCLYRGRCRFIEGGRMSGVGTVHDESVKE